MTLDLPSELANDGAIIVQQVRYRKVTNYGDWHTVACATVIGSPSDSQVFNYRGKEPIDGYDENGDAVTYTSAGEADMITAPEEGIEFYERREDDDAYKTNDYGEYTGNKLQNCLA